eukprot:scaffold104349_cov75-Phaeocystis_antarctica.AAC.2
MPASPTPPQPSSCSCCSAAQPAATAATPSSESFLQPLSRSRSSRGQRASAARPASPPRARQCEASSSVRRAQWSATQPRALSVRPRHVGTTSERSSGQPRAMRAAAASVRLPQDASSHACSRFARATVRATVASSSRAQPLKLARVACSVHTSTAARHRWLSAARRSETRLVGVGVG